MAFHAFRRACRYYSLSLPFAAWWSPQGSDDMAARARPLRVQPSRSEYQRARRAQMGGGRGRGLGRAPQERLPLHGRRGPTRPSSLRLGRAAFDAVMPCRLWVLGWRDADASLCSGLLAAMPRCLCLRLERNSAGRCHCCGPGCRRHRLSRGMW